MSKREKNVAAIKPAALIILAAAFLMALAGCASPGPAPYVPPDLDTYDGLSAAIDSEADILIYDVRSAEETAAGMIPTAVNIPHTEIASSLPRSYRDRVLVVYCQSGGRSRAAYDALVGKGFKYVFDFGSVNNWEGPLE